MSAALAAVALTGAGQVADAALQVILWLLAAAVPVAVAIAAVRSWKRAAAFLRSEQQPRHEDTQPTDVIDDALPRFFEHGERTVTDRDLEPYVADTVLDAIEHMEREWQRKQGNRG